MVPVSEQPRRDVVSYARRSARMNSSQQKAWGRWHDGLVIDVPKGHRDTSIAAGASVVWDDEFGRSAPLIVEIGSGNGDSLVPMAAQLPECNVVAFEVYQPGVAGTLAKMSRQGVHNIRLVVADGMAGLSQLFGPSTVQELWVLFADPWHKSRHHKRRLITPVAGQLMASRLVPGGLLRLATDWQDYGEWMRASLDGNQSLVNEYHHTGGWAPRDADRPVTKYERRGLAAGRQVWDLRYRRRD